MRLRGRLPRGPTLFYGARVPHPRMARPVHQEGAGSASCEAVLRLLLQCGTATPPFFNLTERGASGPQVWRRSEFVRRLRMIYRGSSERLSSNTSARAIPLPARGCTIIKDRRKVFPVMEGFPSLGEHNDSSEARRNARSNARPQCPQDKRAQQQRGIARHLLPRSSNHS